MPKVELTKFHMPKFQLTKFHMPKVLYAEIPIAQMPYSPLGDPLIRFTAPVYFSNWNFGIEHFRHMEFCQLEFWHMEF